MATESVRKPQRQAGPIERQRTAVDRLISLCLEGETSAWREIVRRYEALVYAIPLGRGLSREDAADVAQTTFRILFESLHSVREPENLGLWLMTVARRQVARFLARETRRPDVADPSRMVLLDANSHDETERFARSAMVHECVASLHEPCRSLILALFFDPEEPSYDAIAAQIGRPLGSVGPLRGRCLDRLRTMLVEGGLHD